MKKVLFESALDGFFRHSGQGCGFLDVPLEGLWHILPARAFSTAEIRP